MCPSPCHSKHHLMSGTIEDFLQRSYAKFEESIIGDSFLTVCTLHWVGSRRPLAVRGIDAIHDLEAFATPRSSVDFYDKQSMLSLLYRLESPFAPSHRLLHRAGSSAPS